MNVLFVNNFRSRGGGEEFLGELLPGLAERGLKVGIVCRPDTPISAMFNKTAIHVYPISRSGTDALSSVFKIASLIRVNRYEIINIQRGHDIIQAWLASILSGRRPKLVYTVHVADFMRSRLLLNRMHRIVTISRYLKQMLVDFLPSLSNKVEIIYHGIDLDKFRTLPVKQSPLRSRFGLSRNTPLLGTVGVLWKNQIEFLDALVTIKKELPDVRYALVASDKEAHQIRQFRDRAAELGLSDAILWVGRIPKDDMPSYYTDIDLAVSTFRKEGFGIWIVEALAVGTPVIAFAAGGVQDALEGCPGGVLIKNGTGEMAEEAIRILKDPDLRKRMAAAGPAWVRSRFSRERMTDDYTQFYQGLIE